MIIKDNKTLRNLTTSWYESNDFERIQQHIEQETEELAKIIGNDVIDQAQLIADNSSPGDNDKKLLQKVQLPIALMAVFRYFQLNIVSHDQSTRKIKVDAENEKLPWEWMLDRDDQAHLSSAQRAIDNLIAYLDKTENEHWKDSTQKKASKKLFVNNTEVFGNYYPIDNSARFYYLCVPLLQEIQSLQLRPALGDDYRLLLEAFQQNTLTEYQEELLELTQRAQVLATISLAVRRLNTQVLPVGIVKKLQSESQSLNASRPATKEEITYFGKRMEEDAFNFIDKIKRKRFEQTPEFLEYKLLPKNDPKNKFAST